MSDTTSKDNQSNNSSSKPIPKTVMDTQRLLLEKLMKNPEKQVTIPSSTKPQSKAMEEPQQPKYVSGSSAGAGSGEFHVYRSSRRREYTRQNIMQEELESEKKQREFELKIKNQLDLKQEKTNKNRAKRLRRKANEQNKSKSNNDN